MDYEQQDFASPTETREFPHGRLDLLRIAGADIGRLTLQPGWRWSTDVAPVAGTDLCEAPHFQYHVSGRLRVRTAEGAEFDAVPGQVTALPSGHDAWVVGDEPVALDRSWLPERFGAPLLEADCVDITDSDLYLRLCGVRATSGHERIAALAPTEAEQRLLGMESPEVACAVERVSFADTVAVEVRRTILRSRWFGVTATFSVPDGYRMDLSAAT